MSPTALDWQAITKRNARSVQTTIGWIFWDPGAVRRYTDLGPARAAWPVRSATWRHGAHRWRAPDPTR